MKKYVLTAEVTISIYTEVEAETKEEAIEIANERSIEASRWNDEHQCKKAWCSDEYNGDPQNINVED